MPDARTKLIFEIHRSTLKGWCLNGMAVQALTAKKTGMAMPERIYNSHYGNVYFLLLSIWKVNIAKNSIAVMGL